MKVLMICGSARKNGNTMVALEEVAQQLKLHSIDSEIVQIEPQPVRFCIGCGTCGIKQLDKCVFADDQCNEIIDKFEEADALILGTPVYYAEPNGGLTALMQRAFYAAGNKLNNKPAAGVAVCRRGGATAALQSLDMLFQLNHMPMVTSQYWNIVYGARKGEASQDAEGMQTMRALADNMAYMLQCLHAEDAPVFPEREAHQRTNFIR